MIKILIAIFLGGGIGSVLRYGVQTLIQPYSPMFAFPWATFGVNIAGSFLIGLFYSLSARLGLPEEIRFFLTTGLCGGFTTFSTFTHESLNLLRHNCYGTFITYVIASTVLGIMVAFAGGWAGYLLKKA